MTQYCANEIAIGNDEVCIMQYAHPIKSLFKFLQLLSQEMIDDEPAFADYLTKRAVGKYKCMTNEEAGYLEDEELIDSVMCLRGCDNGASSWYDQKYCSMGCAGAGDHSLFSIRTLTFLKIVNPTLFVLSSDAVETS